MMSVKFGVEGISRSGNTCPPSFQRHKSSCLMFITTKD